ncbi:leucine-rich repeat transmembrane protein FLRT3 [Trichomycterus rosablanca]|uniref:leucine-rich repeat transmembrane protein FLRT3 n=1 Tax=Trichomycterus rosablanca TaxID=2290929 RepID=UPI002F360822
MIFIFREDAGANARQKILQAAHACATGCITWQTYRQEDTKQRAMRLLLLRCLLLLILSHAPSLPLFFPCPSGCCCPRPGVLVLCESLGLRVIPRSVPLTTSALSVARNHLCNVDNHLRRFSSLQELSLGYNRLERFPRGLPSSLEGLQLQENRIAYITAGDLRNLGNLTRLDLEENRIRAIQPGALRGLVRLKILSLRGNRLSSLPSHLPSSLTQLDMSGNCISTLDPPSLAALVDLQVLKINSNCLRSVPEHAFDDLLRLQSVDLADNLWVCECNMMYLYLWLLTHRSQTATDLICAAPLDLAHKLLLTLSVMAICPQVLKPGDRSTTDYIETQGNSSNPSSDVSKIARRPCRTSFLASRSRLGSSRSSLEGLSYEQCLLLNSTYLVPQSTQVPYNEDNGCVGNTTEILSTLSTTPATLYPFSGAGLQFGAPPQTLTQSSDLALVVLLSVLCVLMLLLLLMTLLVLRILLWRNQRVAPLQTSSQRNTGA